MYISERDRTKVRELKPDGTFFAQERVGNIYGKYEVEGDTLVLKTSMCMTVKVKFRNNMMIDPDGEVWVKQ